MQQDPPQPLSSVQEGGRAPEPGPSARAKPAYEPSIFQRRSTEAANRAAAAGERRAGLVAVPEAGASPDTQGQQQPQQHDAVQSLAASTSSTSAEGLRIMSLNQVRARDARAAERCATEGLLLLATRLQGRRLRLRPALQQTWVGTLSSAGDDHGSSACWLCSTRLQSHVLECDAVQLCTRASSGKLAAHGAHSMANHSVTDLKP